jgi:3-oxoacyl-[acyl-carrier-protein] synthase-3
MRERAVKVISTGKYLPKNKVTAPELEKRLGLESGWIQQKSGVLVRHFVADETASEMGAYAAKDALESAGLSFSDIDCLICTSSVPEQAIPCTGALVQKHLGGENSGIPAFDINATCLSFITGVDLISYAIVAQRYRRVLLVATEVTTGLNWEDKESCTLFGDGAAVIIIEQSKESESSRILCSSMKTYSKGSHLSECRGGGNKLHPQIYQENPQDFLFSMDGKGIYKLAAQILPNFVEKLLQSVNLKMADIDLVIPHQASWMALQLMRKHLGVAEEKWMMIIENHGNTVAASVPMGLHEAIVQGKVKRGDLVMLLGTAAGLSLGAILWEY